MKPVSLSFKCFGPYLKEQKIDFTALEKNGLFLICGETGSGKTTILDAMCYALYGRSSGGLRGDLSVMRCKLATPADETSVEFIFDVGDNRYRFYRRIKPKNKKSGSSDGVKLSLSKDFNTICECEMWDGSSFVPFPDGKDKSSYVDKKAEEIIGLNYDQFRQVIILPQGQFEKLLVSESKDKEVILETLFHAERWKNISAKLYEKADSQSKELDKEKLLLDAKLSRYNCRNVENLKEKAAETAEKAENLKVQLKTLTENVDKLKAEKEKLLLQNKDFEELERRLNKYNSLLPRQAAFYNEEKFLERSDAADKISPQYEEYLDALRSKDWYTDDLKKETARKTAAEGEYLRAVENKNIHEQKRPVFEEGKAYLVLLQNAEGLYRSLAMKQTDANNAQQELWNKKRSADEAERAFIKARTDWENAICHQRDARAKYEDTQNRYLEGIGSVLAQQLQQGMPCPVCGSLHHPRPAMVSEGSVSEQELNYFEKQKNAADQQEERIRGLLNMAENRVNSARGLLADAQQKEAFARADYEKTLSMRIEGVENEQQRQNEIYRYSIAVDNYIKADQQVQEIVNNAATNLKSAESNVEKSGELARNANEIFQQKLEGFSAALAQAGFADDREYLSFRIEPAAKNQRRSILIGFKTELDAAKKACEEMQSLLAGREKPDVKAAQDKLGEAERLKDAVNSEYILTNDSLGDMNKDIKELEKRFAAYEKNRLSNTDMLAFAKRLRGDTGVSLQRYVLGVMLSSITVEANRLLKTVYGGRYQLYRSNEASGSSHKRGLELEVGDSSGRRSVTTLSGGEKFLLSLSLAIGLSTVVQAQGSGVKLEAMFIDEGFGSLDRNSIDDALDVLQGVKRNACLVGIISHVERLSETIPAKIEIEKTKDGSQCRISC